MRNAVILGCVIANLISFQMHFTFMSVSAAYSKLVNDVNFDETTKHLLLRLEKPMSKGLDIDIWNALMSLNTTLQRFTEFQHNDNYEESREEAINSRIGVLLFTRFCGPGGKLLNTIFKTDERTYSRIDACCRLHDECPEYVNAVNDYRQYPGLEVRPQFFSR